MSTSRSILFEAQTPLGFTVQVRRAYWNIITSIQHPIMAGCEAEGRETCEAPDEIQRSNGHPHGYLLLSLPA